MSKVWFVTGSSRGLGRALVEAALEGGDRVVATARKPAQLDDLVERYGEHSSASALLGIIPAVVFFLIFQRTLTRGVMVGAIK
ncbi:SDR family NAD(P)-dependent oxidoreductase [Microbispora sp. GKU 823]|uniref:SDR family NAD(P)-dependent oxidoreductase n=1 Tax=Microbispora sp. GKU 823 TaxID=1652100 RepID=UPI0009A44C05|nr:SDR family NAD(P)-dependent oxidoreductase [Microbispora sp. GKU 823]